MEPNPRRGDFVRQLVPDLARVVVADVAVRFRWWMPSVVAGALSAGLFFYCAMSEAGAGWFETRSAGWWVLTTALHLPFLVILVFLVGGLVERLGFYWRGRAPQPTGRLPAVYPTVCVQLPMFNEHAVAQRVIEAASRMTWSRFIEMTADGAVTDIEAMRFPVPLEYVVSLAELSDRIAFPPGEIPWKERHYGADRLMVLEADHGRAVLLDYRARSDDDPAVLLVKDLDEPLEHATRFAGWDDLLVRLRFQRTGWDDVANPHEAEVSETAS
jgi:hypothetical protein